MRTRRLPTILGLRTNGAIHTCTPQHAVAKSAAPADLEQLREVGRRGCACARANEAHISRVDAREGEGWSCAPLPLCTPCCRSAGPRGCQPAAHGQSARASTGACASRASQVGGIAVGGRARRSRSRDMVVDLPGSSRARHSGAVRVCAHEVSEVRGQMAWAHSFSRWRCR